MNNEITCFYALILADKLEALSRVTAWTHMTRGLASAIQRNVAVIHGDMPKPKDTSLGDIDFLVTQIGWAEHRLTEAAMQVFNTNLFYKHDGD